jgi:hypothetical protein
MTAPEAAASGHPDPRRRKMRRLAAGASWGAWARSAVPLLRGAAPRVYSRLVCRARMASGVMATLARSFSTITSNSTNSAPS